MNKFAPNHSHIRVSLLLELGHKKGIMDSSKPNRSNRSRQTEN